MVMRVKYVVLCYSVIFGRFLGYSGGGKDAGFSGFLPIKELHRGCL